MRQLAILMCVILIAVPTVHASPTPQSETPRRVLGIANEIVIASYHPDLFTVCAIRPGETVLAVARADEDYYQIYAGGAECEGRVWISQDAPISWESVTDLKILHEVGELSSLHVIESYPNYDTICQAVTTENASPANIDPTTLQTVYYPGAWSFFPPEFVATDNTGIDAVICMTTEEVSLGICPNVSTRVERIREDITIILAAPTDNSVIARQTFVGEVPPACPSTAQQDLLVRGNPTPRETWTIWVISQLEGRVSERLRTVTSAGRLNARTEPTTDADILTQLSFETPVNLIARNEEATWVVALLPDMTQAWLFVELLEVAVQTDINDLPVTDGLAEEVQLQ